MRKAIVLMLLIAASMSCFAGTITVSGSAEVSAVPDRASFSITASFAEDSTKEAMEKTSALINEAISILTAEFFISDDDITTSYISVYPAYSYSNGERMQIGQEASQTLSVTVEDINSIGALYERLTELNGISLSSVSLSSSRMEEAIKEARTKAIEDARIAAETYASAAGVKIREVMSISDSTSSHTPVYRLAAAEAADSASNAVSYRAGDVTARANATVSFAF